MSNPIMILDMKQPVKPAFQFFRAILKASLRIRKALAISLGMPLFMLFSIWAPAMTGDEESVELMQLIFPAIILLSVIMPGLTQATRLTRWKEQKIFRRLALTPVPLTSLMIGAACTQIVIGVAQGVLMLLFGIFLVGLDLSVKSALLILGSMALAGAAFTAFGSMIAAFSRKPDIAGYVFFFLVMPLTFLASFPPDMLPESINTFTPWLPTSMAIELIGPLFMENQLSGSAFMAGMGLIAYAVIFTIIGSTKKFTYRD